ncbi:MAG: DUF5686 and carboxypeptidase regulatory-like domain-containing protein [Bacteroidetes bacterium]|nr:DUF5686 and carboxypeptidase regulatory-like domain-containing protein [Bacteroidota bacterium]MBU1799803.1 DUF5686 and carboxypeptidase regulatory-like domain-containing protein [Bacteroidota bacterium]
MQLITTLFIILTPILLFAQQYTVEGTITDRINKRPLEYANIQVLNTSLGTSANGSGKYLLRLEKGEYKLLASYIGYQSDTISLNVNMDIPINFKLNRTSLKLDEITVLPKENPANAVIRKTIATKNKRNSKLSSYKFNAYTKGVIKSTQDISANSNSVGIGLGVKDTAELKITGILENESVGYFQKSNNYKEEITAQKQSANFPSSINMLTGGRVIQNFYSDDIKFFGRELVSPIAENALDYYYYFIKDTLAIDNKHVFQIQFEPDYKSNPGFIGNLFITDSTFNLIKLDVQLNDAANPGGIFSLVNIIQQYLPYADSIYMPIDYRLFVSGNFLGMAKFAFDIESVLYNYNINPKIDDDYFDMVVLKILPEAGKMDSSYWSNNQKIPNSLEENEAYKRIDSVEAVPRTFANSFSWLSSRTWLNDNFSTVGTLSLYHFNKVEGHALNGAIYYNDFLNKRFFSTVDFNYGFMDERFKSSFSADYLLGEYRTTQISFSAFNNLSVLFSQSDEYGKLLSTITSLLLHNDFRNHYYSNGFNFNITGAVFPILDLGIGFSNTSYKNSNVNTEFSFFRKDNLYKTSINIYEGKIVTASTNFSLDFRKYIEDGFFRRRTSQGKSFFTLDGEAVFSNKSMLKSNLDFQIYKLNLYVNLNSFKSTKYILEAKGFYSSEAIPYQLMRAIPGNVSSLGKDFTFRTVNIFSTIGDRVFTVTSQYQFNDELFKMLRIPFLENARLNLDAHFNIAWLSILEDSKNLNATSFQNYFPQFIKPLYEIGFGIGHQLIPLKLEFTWRLNHRDENSFVIGINSFAF